MSEASKIFKKTTLAVAGHKWELGRPNLLTEAAYSTHLQEKEANGIKLRQASLGPNAFRIAMEIHLDRCDVGNWFGWMRPGFTMSLGDPKNVVKFMWLWIGQFYADENHALSESQLYDIYRENFTTIVPFLEAELQDPSPLPAE